MKPLSQVRSWTGGPCLSSQSLFNAQLGLIAIYILLTMWYVLIKEKSIFSKAISVVLPEQVWCWTGTVKVFCNGELPLNAHYQVFSLMLLLDYFHTAHLKGEIVSYALEHALDEEIMVDQLGSVRCFLQVVQNHNFSNCRLWTELNGKTESLDLRLSEAAIPHSLPVP